jgi:hypothetical protein
LAAKATKNRLFSLRNPFRGLRDLWTGLGKSYGCLQWRGDGIRWPSFMSEGQEQEAFMREAIAEAQSVDERRVYPNPRVGAVIVENGAIVARGRFEQDGGMHAERRALNDLGRAPAPDAVLYVTF